MLLIFIPLLYMYTVHVIGLFTVLCNWCSSCIVLNNYGYFLSLSHCAGAC